MSMGNVKIDRPVAPITTFEETTKKGKTTALGCAYFTAVLVLAWTSPSPLPLDAISDLGKVG